MGCNRSIRFRHAAGFVVSTASSNDDASTVAAPIGKWQRWKWLQLSNRRRFLPTNNMHESAQTLFGFIAWLDRCQTNVFQRMPVAATPPTAGEVGKRSLTLPNVRILPKPND